MTTTKLPPPPRVAFVDPQTGLLTRDGDLYIRALFARTGGSSAPSLADLFAQTTTLTTEMASTGWEETIPGTGDAITDNSGQFSAKVSPTGSLVTSGNVRARYKTQGTYRFDSLQDVHPSISLEMSSRGGIILQPDGALPGTNAQGAEAALLRIVRDSPNSAQNLAWGFSLSGVNLDARGVTLANQVHGIRVPNADPSKNPLDPDPQFAGNKDYVAGAYSYGDVVSFSGSGVLVESTNGRFDAMSFRALNNALNGFDLGGNDIVMHGHWAAGGNGLFGVKAGDASGFLVTTGNIWGDSAARSVSCGAMWLNQRKLFTVGGCEFNDWLRMDGGNSFQRGGAIYCNDFAPFNELFTADGVAIDNTPGGDSRLQAHIGIVEYQSANFVGNQFFRSTKVGFATPNNVGGDLTGKYGTAFQYLYDVGPSAMVNCIDTISSAPNVKPWVNTDATLPSYLDPTPYNAHNGGQVNYFLMDSYLCMTRIGAKGPVHSKIMLGVSETDDSNPIYAIEAGDHTLPAGVPYRNALYGMWEFGTAVQYQATAWDARVTANAGTRTLKAGQVYQLLSTAGAGIASYTIGLPNGMNAAYELTIELTGGPIAALAWTGTVNTNTFALPSSTNGPVTIRLLYRQDVDQWYVTNVARRADPFITLASSGAVASDCSLGSNFYIKLTANGTLANPSNPTDGGVYTYIVQEDATGGWTFGLSGGKLKTPGGVAPSFTTTANAINRISFKYNAALDLFLMESSGAGYA